MCNITTTELGCVNNCSVTVLKSHTKTLYNFRYPCVSGSRDVKLSRMLLLSKDIIE